MLVTKLLVTKLLVTKMLDTKLLVTELLVTKMLDTKMLDTNLLVTELLVTKMLDTKLLVIKNRQSYKSASDKYAYINGKLFSRFREEKLKHGKFSHSTLHQNFIYSSH